MPTKYLASACLILIFINACTKKVGTLEKPQAKKEGCGFSYHDSVKPIIAAKCASGNCHVANFPFGDLSRYAVLNEKIEKGKFKTLVFDAKIMPPADSPQLSDEEIQKLECWIAHGYPEN